MRSQKVTHGLLFVAFFVALLQMISSVSRSIFQESGVCNAAAAWGLDLPFPVILFLSLGALIIFFIFWAKEKNTFLCYLWLILFSAGSSNFLERTLSGCVFDYIEIPYIPAFNIADLLLTICVISIFYIFFKNEKKLDFK